MRALGVGLAVGADNVAPDITANVVVYLESVCSKHLRYRVAESVVAGGAMSGADDDLVIEHAARTAGMAIEQQGVAIGVSQLAQHGVERGVIGIVKLEIGRASCRERV